MSRLGRRIIIGALFTAIILGGGLLVNAKLQELIADKERVFDEKVGILTEQIEKLSERVQRISGTKTQDELLTAAVAKVAPAVVSIVISKDVPKLEVSYENPFGNDPFFKGFNFRVPVYKQKGTVNQKVGAGTGFIVSSDGFVLTNRHVVADPNATYTALLSDGTQKSGRVVFRDTVHDVALVKIEGTGLKTVVLGDSDTLKLGQTVVAIGNALGEYNNSVSVGIISGLNRTLQAGGGGETETLAGVIQTDAAINPGNSGGPLLNLSGEAIGINVATVLGSSNISFSIPVNVAKMLVDRYIMR